ncbi:hypothetical protein Tco_0953739 [Tanacetum coccineum]|uniref:Integrase, catalytic region, zinc finger, CCHC-type, peptidase aspartic, catalytic n=1 Tax=Tanacetum coccineum TaxID=301880 RepID=A0ABQ5E496_9ASTR
MIFVLNLGGWELLLKENFFCTIGNRDHVNACTAYMLYYLTIKRKFNFTTMILYRMEEVKKNNSAPMPFAMLLTCLYNHILRTNPQAIIPLNKFTFHESFGHFKESYQGKRKERSSSNVIQIHTPFEHLGRWTKDHPIANVIGDPSRSVSTRKQLETDAMWCYFDAVLTSVEPKNFKQAMTEPLWIDAMQEEIHEFLLQGNQNRRDLPRDIPLDSVVVLRYEKRSKSENKGKVPTEMELVLEQTQQGSSYEVSVSAKGVEELKRKVKIKGEKKEALLTLRQKPERFDTSAGNPVKEILLKLNLPDHRSILIDLNVTPTKHRRMTKQYLSPRFIANYSIPGICKDGDGGT